MLLFIAASYASAHVCHTTKVPGCSECEESMAVELGE